MKKFLVLFFLLASLTSFGQFSNYTNINGRYKWIAGKFDSTFTLPSGSTPSLRTGGGTGAGAMFYRTTDSTIYQYTGTQWLKLRGSINPTDTAGLWITSLYRKTGTDSVFYVKGGSHTFAFEDSVGTGGGGGGGKIYYFNGGTSQGTFGGFTMYQLGDTAVIGSSANFSRATTGTIANFITDANKPGLLQIPAGAWTIDAWMSETGGGANHAEVWAVLEKWNGSTITTIATSPIEQITNGNVPDLYTWTISVPTTTIAATDRIIIQFYITNTNGKTVTLYTQNGYVAEVHTTFTTGIGALNGLTAATQYFATGTSGTDFAISSSTATHTFNLPTASATNRGALSSADWTTFNGKVGGSGTTNYVSKFTASGTIGNSQIFDNGTNVGIGTTSPGNKLHVVTGSVDGIRIESSGSGYLEIGKTSLARYRWANDYYVSSGLELLYGASGASPTESRLTIFPNGNIGVNVIVDAGYKLDVNGTARIRTSAYFATSSGNVLIGTTTDNGQKLQVSGTSLFTSTINVNMPFTPGVTSSINFGSNSLNYGTTGINMNMGSSQYNNGTAFYLNRDYTNTGAQSILTAIDITNNWTGRDWDALSTGNVYGIKISQSTANMPIYGGRFDVTLTKTNPSQSAYGVYSSATITGTGNAYSFYGAAGTLYNAGSVGIGTTSPNASALLDVSSTTKGLLVPRMTNAQMVAIATPAAGLVVYDTTNNKLNVYDGTNWVAVH